MLSQSKKRGDGNHFSFLLKVIPARPGNIQPRTPSAPRGKLKGKTKVSSMPTILASLHPGPKRECLVERRGSAECEDHIRLILGS